MTPMMLMIRLTIVDFVWLSCSWSFCRARVPSYKLPCWCLLCVANSLTLIAFYMEASGQAVV